MFRTLRWKIAVSYLSLIVLAMAILGLYLLFMLDRLQVERLEEDLKETAFLAQASIAPKLAAGDLDGIQALLNESNRRLTTRVLVTDASGRLVASTEPEDVPAVGKLVDLPGLRSALSGSGSQGISPVGAEQAREVAYVAEPLYFDGKLIGAMRLAYQLSDIDRVMHNLYLAVGAGIAGVGALALAVSLAIAGAVTRPLARLRQATIDVAANRRRPPLPATSKDEIGELTLAFNTMTERLRELEAMRRDFLADVSHEIHTLSAAMGMAAEALAQGAREQPATYDRLVGGLADHVDRLNRLADDLIQLSRLERGQLDLHDQPCRLDAIAERTAAQFLAEAERRGIDLQLEAEEPLPIQGDPIRLGQVGSNLVSNALKFTPRGGQVWVRSFARGGQAILEVRDTGAGIPEADLPFIFDRYFRAKPPPGAARPGMGLGLAIARGIAQVEHGEIVVSSNVGQGSRFRLVLPLAEPPAGVPVVGERVTEQPAAPFRR